MDSREDSTLEGSRPENMNTPSGADLSISPCRLNYEIQSRYGFVEKPKRYSDGEEGVLCKFFVDE